jgi:tetratricopeptide (TPR) repeat protein
MKADAYPWIRRKIAKEIYRSAIAGVGSVQVYFVEAEAGMGKTYLARDIGTRLGSPTGYEPAKKSNILWSGILDVYDPTTNSNQGIERQLMAAFSLDRQTFDAYSMARDMYDAWFKSGIRGSGLEEQRHRVEQAFAEGLQEVCETCRPVIVLDTIERLEGATDPVQQKMEFFGDTASVTGWLIYQITQLRDGVVLLLGRQADRFYEMLKAAIERANQSRVGLVPIELHRLHLTALDDEELDLFLENRKEHYPALQKLLDDDLIQLLAQRTEGNPLLLDIAFQSLLETGDPTGVREALESGKGGMRSLECALLEAYMNAFDNPDRQILMRYLALARSGLFAELLQALEPARADWLAEELDQMEALPFIKVREISTSVPGQTERVQRRTYFLHDAMYTICDELLLKPQQVMEDSERILTWYAQRIVVIRSQSQPAERQMQRLVPGRDLLVESLFYRMRANPAAGYHWYLQQTYQAIHSAQTGLDMRLRDALVLFLVSAGFDEGSEPGHSLSSPIDRAIVSAEMPRLFDDFRLDSISMWITRYTTRGKLELAERIGREMQPQAEAAFDQDPDRYRLALAELLLWYGQVVMYGYQIDDAMDIYHRVINILGEVSLEDKSAGDFERWRLGLVLGRAHNNIGYTLWMYQGRYTYAIREFQQALRFFKATGIEEEIANTSDNMGRVYALLGQEFQGVRLIKNGIELRRYLELTYREALSLNSLAMVFVRFGYFDLAIRAIEDALIHYRRTGVERGIGLGLLTSGMIYRSMAEMWRDLEISIQDGLHYTDKAETDLRDALRIFSTAVLEPIRLAWVNNEMGCCYRARYFLLAQSDAADADQEMAFAQARPHFRRAIQVARKNDYLISELDSLQDEAVLLMRAGEYAEAEGRLQEIVGKIPGTHKIHTKEGLDTLDEYERVDAYYKLMGQVELLAGAITFERGKLEAHDQGQPGDKPTKERLLETARHYLFAISYFNTYSGAGFVKRLTYERIYNRFQGCTPALVTEIAQKHLPRWVEEYNLPDELVRDLFRDVFGLF